MRKMKKMKYLRFLMKIQVECQTQSQMHQSYPPKEMWVQAWPILRRAQAEIKAGPIWLHHGRRSSKEKKQKKIPPNRMIQQEFLTLLTTQPTFQRRINVVSTLWINVEITLIQRWKWNKIRRRIFNIAQRWYNVGVRRWNNVETALIQVCLNFVPTWPQHQ